MATPTEKSPAMEKLIDSFNPSGRKRKDSILNDVCSWCGKSVTGFDFRDDVSRKEYTISGFCQQCQDKTFGTDTDDDDNNSNQDKDLLDGLDNS